MIVRRTAMDAQLIINLRFPIFDGKFKILMTAIFGRIFFFFADKTQFFVFDTQNEQSNEVIDQC